MTPKRSRRFHLWLILIVSGLFVRCNCWCWPDDSDDDHKEHEERAVRSASYRSVGEPCVDDFSGNESWGCGGADDSETCARNLLCCPNPAYNSYTAHGSRVNTEAPYICVASSRCESSDPGEHCNSHRDCPIGYDCVSARCRGPVGVRCNDNIECTTSVCRYGYCAYPEEPELDHGWFDSRVPDVGIDADVDGKPADGGSGASDLETDVIDGDS